MHVVIETPDYLVDAKALGLTADERRSIVDYIAQTPDAGVEMKGTGGARKIRFDGRGKEKAEGTGLLPSMPEKIFLYSCYLYFQKVKEPIYRNPKEMN